MFCHSFWERRNITECTPLHESCITIKCCFSGIYLSVSLHQGSHKLEQCCFYTENQNGIPCTSLTVHSFERHLQCPCRIDEHFYALCSFSSLIDLFIRHLFKQDSYLLWKDSVELMAGLHSCSINIITYS